MATDTAKLVDQLGKMTVLELVELKNALEETWGVTAAAPVDVAAPGAAPAAGGDGAGAGEGGRPARGGRLGQGAARGSRGSRRGEVATPFPGSKQQSVARCR